jgi:hypothetical protein
MMRTAASKVMWIGKATIFLVGLSVILALIFGVASTAFSANGNPFLLGKKNVATTVSTLLRKGAGPALKLEVASGQPPLVANAAAGKATNLNADKLDGQDVTQIGVNGLQRVEVESPSNNTSPKQITASCPDGKVLVGTGFDIFGGKRNLNTGNAKTDIVIDFVIPGSTFVTVAAYEEEEPLEDWSVKAIAICATAGTP